MADRHAAPDLRPLENGYKIIGELRGNDDARTFLARRIDTGEEVLITAVRAPKSDGSNALNHYAADTKLLSGLAHPNMPRVIEGRWLGNDAFAVITARPMGETLGEVLSRGEQMSFPRIASVLQDVKGVLDWARDNGVVHRGVTVDSLVFERDTDQVLLSLLPMPIGIDSVPGPCDDARTIGRLARAMITGEPPQNGEVKAPIAELRPDLSKRVAEETDRMVACANTAQAPDVSAFIGVVAMADALKEGEDTVDRLKAEFAAEQAAERERFDAEMNACRQEAAEQAAAFAAEREAARQQIAEQQTQLAAERAQYDQERLEFDRARDELEQQRAAFAEERATFERERDEWNDQRASLEQRLAALEQALAAERERGQEERERIVAERDQARAERDRAQAARDRSPADAVAVPVLTEAAVEEAVEKSRRATRDRKAVPETVVPIETGAETRSVAMKTPTPTGAQWEKAPPSIAFGEKSAPTPATDAEGTRRWPWASWRPSWTRPTAIAAALVLFGASVAIARHENSHNALSAIELGGANITPTLPRLDTTSMPRGGFLTQTAGGTLAARGPAFPLAAHIDSGAPAMTSDSLGATSQVSAGEVAPNAGAPATTPTPTPTPSDPVFINRQAPRALGPRITAQPTPRPAPRESLVSTPPLIDTTRHDSILPLRMIVPRRDSAVRRDSAAPRRDTTVRRDTVRPDTSVTRPDTGATHDRN